MIAVEEINLTDLKHQFYNYISYQYYTLRSLLWRILLEYLPPRNNKWITKIEATRVNYEKLLNDNLISSIKRRGKEAEGKELKVGRGLQRESRTREQDGSECQCRSPFKS